MTAQKPHHIKRQLLYFIATEGKSVVQNTVHSLGITKQGVYRHLKKLISEGIVCKDKRNHFYLSNTFLFETEYSLLNSIDEDVIWRNDIKPLIGKNMSQHSIDMWSYVITEMINNVIDHSSGTKLTIQINKEDFTTTISIIDNGVGIFNKIQKARNLEHPKQALFELSKGKLTTDPERHTGEGIFFSSKVCDEYEIHSGNLYFNHKKTDDNDWLFEASSPEGTSFSMTLLNQRTDALEDTFKQFMDADFDFSQTIFPIKLNAHKNDLVSRSQAKRLLIGAEKFKTIILDFGEVPKIGQGFADEIFRVYANNHPDVDLIPLYTNQTVSQMIQHTILNRSNPETSS